MKRRFLSMLLCLTMLIGISPTGVLADKVTDIQNDEIQTFAGAADPDPNGDGTADSPYLITSLSELKWLSNQVNNGDTDICARLMSNIELTEDITEENWTAIGTAENPYTGTFDGNNYSIKNTAVGKSSTWEMSPETSGLFGYVGEKGVIKSLNVQLYMNTKGGTSLLTYENNGTIEQCTVHALVGDANDVTKDTPFCNFAYKNIGTIKNCLSVLNSNVSNDAGFAETNSGTIENSLCAIIESGGADISQAYAIAKTNDGGTVTNCCCTLYNVSFGEPLDSNLVTTSYLDRDESERATIIKQIVWKLNNGSTDPWRYDKDGTDGFNSNYYPSLDPTDAKIKNSDGSKTVTPHTHRVDGVIKEFAELPDDLLNLSEGDGGCYYLEKECMIWNDPWKVPDNVTLCLNGHSFKIGKGGSIDVPSGKNFTVTDCSKTAGEITVDTSFYSTDITGVTVSGGTFVLDNVSVTGCETGIDYQSGTVKLSGKAKVMGNTQNIKLAEGQKLTFGILDETARFGITYGGTIDDKVEIADKTGLPYAQQLMSDSDELVINTDENAVVLTRPAEHKHCICGKTHHDITYDDVDGNERTAHTEQDETVFRPWNPYSHQDENGNPTLPEKAGSYYLTQSVELPNNPAWQPVGEINLCLNGMTVTFTHVDPNGNDNGLVWLDAEDDRLTVTDCGDAGTLKMADDVTGRNCIRILNGAEFNLYAGTMTNFARAVSIGNVRAWDSDDGSATGTFEMYGGTLTGNVSGTPNSTGLGSAVSATGENAHVVLYNGKIINNKTAGGKRFRRCGGGVLVEGGGSFTMYGGEISGNGKVDESQQGDEYCGYGAAYGGGVFVNGTFTMTGGKISGNTVTPAYSGTYSSGSSKWIYYESAAAGGGVYVIGTLTMTGGEISGNTVTKGCGGGVYLRNTGESASIKNAVIRGNTVEEHMNYQSSSGGGGGICYRSSTDVALTLENTTVSDNTLYMNFGNSNGYGGGAGVYGDMDITINHCKISGNKLTGMNKREPLVGAFGGAGVCVPLSNLTIKDSDITGNTAISDAKATDEQKLVSGGVLFCNSEKTFTVSGKVNIIQNKVDGDDGNVYLEKRWNGSDAQKQQTTIWAGELDRESSIGVMARTAENGDVQVAQVNSEDGTIPTGVFTSDKGEYKTVLANENKSVNLTVNKTIAEVIHSNGTKDEYDGLWKAIKAAQAGETVKVLQNCDFPGSYQTTTSFNIDKNITLDLNNKTVTVKYEDEEEESFDYYLTISADVTIKNGSIIGSRTQTRTSAEALITINNGNLILDNVNIKNTDKSVLALYASEGSLTMTGGTIDGGFQITANASAELTGGTFKKAESYGFESGDGAIVDRFINGAGISRLLKKGYAYYDADKGEYIDLSAAAIRKIETGKTITVKKCENHKFNGTSENCIYCGSVCDHQNINTTTYVCEDCGAPMAAMLILDNKDAYFISLSKALESAKDGDTITILCDTSDNADIDKDITIDLGGHKLTSGSENRATITIKGNTELKNGTVEGIKKFAVYVESGGKLTADEKTVLSNGNIGNNVALQITENASAMLSIGTKVIGLIRKSNGSLSDIIPQNTALQNIDENGAAIDESYSPIYEATKAKNVVVIKHLKHEWSNGTCKVCGLVCDHKTADDTMSKCPVCNAEFAAAVTFNGTTTRYIDITSAFTAAQNFKAEDAPNATVKVNLLTSGKTYNLTAGTGDTYGFVFTDSAGAPIEIDLNGNTIMYNASNHLAVLNINDRKMTLKNGTLDGPNCFYGAINISGSNADVTLENISAKSYQPGSGARPMSLQVTNGAHLTVKGDCTFNKQVNFDLGTKISLCGGTFEGGIYIYMGTTGSYEDVDYSPLLADGYAFATKGTDGNYSQIIAPRKLKPESGYPSASVKIVGHSEHTFDITGNCSCDKHAAARVTDLYGSSEVYKWYLSLEDAFESVTADDKGNKAKQITTYNNEYALSDDIHVKGEVQLSLSGADVKIRFNDGKSFVVDNGNTLYVGGNGYINAVTVKDGGGFDTEAGITTGSLTAWEDSKVMLSYGNFDEIKVEGNATVGKLTNDMSTYKHTGENESWLTDDELNGKSITNVKVVYKPFYSESITVSQGENLTYQRGLTVTMNVNKMDSTTDYGETTYEWFATHSPDNVFGRSSSCTTSLTMAGSYEFGCRITRGGYTRIVTKTITVNKGNSGYTTEPKAKENLVYSGEEKELIDAGTLSTDQKILYKLDNGDWSENIPKATDAGKYTVHYKVEENDNYTGIAEKTIDVTIAKQVLKDIVTDSITKQYDGTVGLPSGFSITKFTAPDGSEFKLQDYELTGEYESAGAGENKKVTLTVKLGNLAKNYVFDNNTAEKAFERTGTINKAIAPQQDVGELIIVKRLERVYTYDLSTLLDSIPYESYGKITYELDENDVDISGYYNKTEGKATINENGILTLPIQYSYGVGYDSAAGTIRVKVTTDNYNDYKGDPEIILTVNITAMDKIQLDLRGKPTLNPTSITYGQKLSAIELLGSLKDFDGNKVEGRFAWTAPNTTPPVGKASAEWNFTPNDTFYMYEKGFGTAEFNVDPKNIAGASYEAFDLVYNGSPQTPTAKVTVDGMEVTGKWSPVTNVSDKTTFTASGNFSGTLEDVETNMKPKDINNADISLGDNPEYNGSEQTQGITSIIVDGIALRESDYTISDNTAINVKADGNYVLSITGKGNFAGTKTAEWNIKPTAPTESVDKKTTARVRRGRTLAEATVTNGEFLGVDRITALDGTFAWVDNTKVISANGTEEMTFTPNDKNYTPITIDVAVSAYSPGGDGSSSSNTVYTVKFDTNGGNVVENQTVKKNDKVSEPVVPKKEGYKFSGWFSDKDLKTAYDFDAKVTKSFTLYAAWTKVEIEPDPNPTDKPENPGEDLFDDVSKDDWYYNDVKSAVEKGLFNGTGSKTFAPNDNVTRGMIVTVLYRAEGEPEVNTAISFADVSADSYYANAVIWAKQNGIVDGYSDTEFAPDDNLTREQIAAMMFRYAKYKGIAPTGAWAIKLDYADLESVSDYALEAVMYCTLNGIMQGKDNNLFAPQDSATRAEIAAILNRFIDGNK